MQNSLAQAATAANEAVILRKNPIDIEQTHNLSVLFGIGRKILMLLKCILALVFLLVVGIVYIVARLSQNNTLCGGMHVV